MAQTDNREGAEEACPGVGEEAGRSRDVCLPEGRGSIFEVEICSWAGHSPSLFPSLSTLDWEIFKGSEPACVEHFPCARLGFRCTDVPMTHDTSSHIEGRKQTYKEQRV